MLTCILAYCFLFSSYYMFHAGKSKSKAKAPHLEDNLVIIKDPKRRVSLNSIIQGRKGNRHTT